jgi:hypothetical protein
MNNTAQSSVTLRPMLAGGLLTLLLSGCVIAPSSTTHRTPPPPPVQSSTEPMYFYPERGQSEGQQDRDRYDCYRWAARETGSDPGMQPVQRNAAPAPEPVQRDGSGAVVGAVTGAVIGGMMSSHRQPLPGMVMGAIFGGMLGAAADESRTRQVERQQDYGRRDWEQRQGPSNNFRRAMSACMAGRGYTVR